ncbi:MAG TPA: SPFH domain-containing protein [Nocardioidaceae bacterium]|nr:SPFH domain-containing protein [Nocardioidaceae bacterium]
MTLFGAPPPMDPSDVAVAAGGFWLVAAAVVLVMILGSAWRVVPENERLVVSRLGRVSRLAGPGLVFRMPGLERGESVSLLPVRVALAVAAETRGGVRVRLDVDALYRVTDPALATTVPDVRAATEQALETALQREVAQVDIHQVLRLRDGLGQRLPRDLATCTRQWGVDPVAVEVTDIETRLTPALLRSVR